VAVEDGTLSLADVDMHVARIKQASDLDSICATLATKTDAIDVMIVDSLTAWAEMVLQEQLAATKDGRAAYGQMQTIVKRFLQLTMPSVPQHVICTAKQERVMTETGNKLVPNMPGQTLTHKAPVAHDFDFVWCLQVVKDGDNAGKRYLQTDPAADPRYLCKTRDPWGRVQPIEPADLGRLFAKLRPAAEPSPPAEAPATGVDQ